MPKTGQQPIKYPGGKAYLAKDIIAKMPRHLHYTEPFAGGLAVLFQRAPDDESLWLPPHKGVSEIVNDINLRLTNFWRVLQVAVSFAAFKRIVEAVPFSRVEFNGAVGLDDLIEDCPVDCAVNFFIRARQSRSGMMKGFTSVCRNRTRRQMNGNVSEWLGAVDGLADVHARLRRVLIENMDATKFMEREDGPGAFHYCDPPYVHSTRNTKDLYAHEMTEADHARFLDTAKQCKGKVMISGYLCCMYEIQLSSWNRHEFNLPNHLAGGASKAREIECLWCNY